MAIAEHVKIFKKGSQVWNAWRDENPHLSPDLSDVDFESDVHTYKEMYDMSEFTGYNLSHMNLNPYPQHNTKRSYNLGRVLILKMVVKMR